MVGASVLAAHCGPRYGSCEETRSCPLVAAEAAGDGALGAAGPLPDEAAGSAGSAGTLGAAGDAGTAVADAAGGSAGSGVDAADVQPDTTAPTIVSVTPLNGANGIVKDANIVIVFSEPMDQAKTQAAYSSVDLAPANVAFTWSADRTTLTIDPKSDLAYEDDTVPSTVAAKRYAFSIASSAADIAGNTLATKFDAQFSTLRRVTQKLSSDPIEIREQADDANIAGACNGQNLLLGALAGTWSGGILNFDLSVFAPGLRTLERAQLDIGQASSSGEPFGPTKLGEIACDHTSVDPATSATLDAPALRRMGILSANATHGPRSIDVLAAVVEDYQHRLSRSYRSQYRIAFTTQNPDVRGSLAFVVFDCVATLSLRYLVP